MVNYFSQFLLQTFLSIIDVRVHTFVFIAAVNLKCKLLFAKWCPLYCTFAF